MATPIKTAWERALDLIYPRGISCALCGVELDKPGVALCPDCAPKLPPAAGPACPGCGRSCTGEEVLCRACRIHGAVSDGGFAAHDYAGLARGMLVALKFDDHTGNCELFAHGMARAVTEGGAVERIDCVVPVPMHWMRRFSRGYNQSELLAARMAALLGKPLMCRALARPVHTRIIARSAGGPEERVLSAQKSYRPGREPVRGMTVLLVDDILTTGSTLRVCVSILKQMGAEKVFTVVAAAVPE